MIRLMKKKRLELWKIEVNKFREKKTCTQFSQVKNFNSKELSREFKKNSIIVPCYDHGEKFSLRCIFV